jgi:PAS domain S-box-containing protein
VLYLTADTVTAILVCCLVLIGDALDCLFLRHLKTQVPGAATCTRYYRLSTITAVFQALTIATCGVLLAPVAEHSPLFFIAFLMAAAFGGGSLIVFHTAAGLARLAIYGGTAIIGSVAGFWAVEMTPIATALNSLGVVILLLVVAAFIRVEMSSFRGTRKHLAAIQEKTASLSAMNSELRAREEEAKRLSLVAEHANDAVIISDADGCICWTNDAFTTMTGYHPEEVQGRSVAGILNGPDTEAATIAAITDARASGKAFRGEIQNVTKDGRSIWIETNQVPVLDERGNIEMIVAIERDITATKAAAAELEEAKARAEQSGQAKATFLATMSHEIRTPINGVIGMAELLGSSELNQEQRLYVETIQSSAELLLAIVNDVLDMSKLDAGKMTLEMADCDLRQVMRDGVQLLAPQADAKNLEINVHLSDDVPALFQTDPVRLRQVLLNLLSNAIKFTEKGAIDLRATVSHMPDGRKLVMEVTDTGIGIPKDKLDSIFDEFSQAEASTTRRFGGTGLGLAICRQLIEAMDGEIDVRSELGVGTTFRFVLPMVAADRPDAAEPVGALPDIPAADVLVADDNRTNRILVQKMLKDTPARLRFAEDGQFAVDAVTQHPPDVILMDMSMPRKGGLEATREIRAMTSIRQPAIIALTANAMSSDRAACRAAGVNDFLSKPVKRLRLLTAIASALKHDAPE